MVDVAVIGGGAAGMTAAIFAAGQFDPEEHHVVVLDGASKTGDKILVSGGGRCNVTNDVVTADDYCGGSKSFISDVLSGFDSDAVQAWFAEMGAALKTEPDGRIFSANDNSHTILNALLKQIKTVGAELRVGHRVTGLRPQTDGFVIQSRGPNGPREDLQARVVIIATGGLAMPGAGCDGSLMQILRRFGHTIVPTTPALAGLTLASDKSVGGSFCVYRGTSTDGILRLYKREGEARTLIAETRGQILFTHFGLNGPAPLDLSRHWLRARHDDPNGKLEASMALTQHADLDKLSKWFLAHAEAQPRRFVSSVLARLIPLKAAKIVAAACGGDVIVSAVDDACRAAMLRGITDTPITITGTRGYEYAETTAGGIDLNEIDVASMQSQRIPGLYICGEICDVDGRSGGFNHQWAWSSGARAGRAAAQHVKSAQTASTTA